MSVRPKADLHLGWAYRPDKDTLGYVSRGLAKFRKHPELGSDRPHEGGSIKADTPQPKRRKKMAKRVTKKKTTVTASKKKTAASKAPTGKLIPLKTICAELDLDPKATRVKLRRLVEKGDISFHDMSQRWEFTAAQAKEIRSHLE